MAGVTLKRERWPEFHSAATTESARADAADASRARTTRETSNWRLPGRAANLEPGTLDENAEVRHAT